MKQTIQKQGGGAPGCALCPRGCGVDRDITSGGCGVKNTLKIARAALHMWEEPCISGSRGSGTVFFSGCSLRCVFCQNEPISHGAFGREVSAERLAEIFLKLQADGAHNINLVTPTHFAPGIISALGLVRERGLAIPAVWNTSGYETVETLKSASGFADVYLADFKYMSPLLAEKYSGARDYPAVAKAAFAEMFRQTGPFLLDKDGLMTRGVIARVLALPTHADDAKRILAYLYETYGDGIYISIMSQFTPTPACAKHPEINRRVTAEEYDGIVDFALALGVKNAYTQEGEAAAESFIPPFDLTGV